MPKFENDTGNYELDLALSRLNADDAVVGQNWSITRKAKILQKFGRDLSLQLNTRSLLWEVETDQEVFLDEADGNLIDTISSSAAGDTGIVIIVEGHYYNGDGKLVFHVQLATLNGQNKVTLAQPLCRCSRLKTLGSTAVAGDVHAYQDSAITGGVPNNLNLAHNVIKGTIGERKTFKAQTSVSDVDALILTRARYSIQRKQAATVDFRLEKRLLGELFQPEQASVTLNSAGQTTIELTFDPPYTIEPNSDVGVFATSDTNNVSANATFSGYLANRSDPL